MSYVVAIALLLVCSYALLRIVDLFAWWWRQ